MCVQHICRLHPASMVEQVNKRGVYSFCMCPRHHCSMRYCIWRVVTNGWSPSKRNNPFANSGFVVSVEEKDAEAYAHHGPLKGLAFQMATEYNAWQYGGYTQAAPAQRMVDFVQKKATTELPACSYQPGVVSARMSEVCPILSPTDYAVHSCRSANISLPIIRMKPSWWGGVQNLFTGAHTQRSRYPCNTRVCRSVSLQGREEATQEE